jgi:cytochrome b561
MSDLHGLVIVADQIVPVALLLLMLLMVEVGWRLGHRARARGSESVTEGISTATVAIFGLLSLMLALTFSDAAQRYDKRRDLIIREGQTISTVYQSISLLKDTDQPALQSMLKDYLDLRIAMYTRPIDLAKIEAQFAMRDKVESAIWEAARASVKATPFPDNLLAARILDAISTMTDAADSQHQAQYMRPPTAIVSFLFILTLIGALLAGYVMGIETSRDWFLAVLYAVLMSFSFAIILDLDYPRIGLINLDQSEQTLLAIRRAM